jgi:hypothetical protein
MTPWKKAYNTAMACGISSQEYSAKILECLENGVVISTPMEFLAALDAEHDGQPAWFVYMAAGGPGNVLGRFMRYAPEPRPYVLWHRHNEDRRRVFAWDKLIKKARI